MKKVLSILALAFLTACGVPYSDGDRAGIITKFAYKGIFCKTWEGEMNLGGMRREFQTDREGNTSFSMVPNVWAFTVTEDEHVKKIQHAMDTGAHVKLSYTQKLWSNPCTTSTGYFITKVQ